MPTSRRYVDSLSDSLQDPAEAAAYLTAALEEDEPGEFLLALKDVADAHGGMTAVARDADLNRENLYRMLSKQGNPRIYSLNDLLHALGLKLAIEIADSRA